MRCFGAFRRRPCPTAAGCDSVVLSHLPGDALGVRTLAETYGEAGEIHPAFATNLRGENTRLPIHSVADDLALIVVAAKKPTTCAWAEQLRAWRRRSRWSPPH